MGDIIVGASDIDNLRTWYSNYGTELDILAPGGYDVGISTLDPVGSNGVGTLSSDYLRALDGQSFIGTSASAPIVSGVIALMLEENSSMTLDEVTNALHTKSDKIGNMEYVNGHNNYYGYGKINVSKLLPYVDTDGDGIEDRVDSDDDNDGVLDKNDAFPLNSHEWLDTDHDGIGNNADKDDDNDGISDADEIKWGFDPLDASDGGNADTDGDGVNNADEIEAGSDPLDPDDTKKPKKFVPIMMNNMVIMVPFVK